MRLLLTFFAAFHSLIASPILFHLETDPKPISTSFLNTTAIQDTVLTTNLTTGVHTIPVPNTAYKVHVGFSTKSLSSHEIWVILEHLWGELEAHHPPTDDFQELVQVKSLTTIGALRPKPTGPTRSTYFLSYGDAAKAVHALWEYIRDYPELLTELIWEVRWATDCLAAGLVVGVDDRIVGL